MTKEEITSFYQSNMGIHNAETLKLLTDNTKYERYKKNSMLFEPETYRSVIHFLLSGVIRGYVIDEDGHEQTIGFGNYYGEACLGASGMDEEIQNYVQCMTDVEVLSLSMPAFMQAIESDRDVAHTYELLIQEESRRHFDIHVALSKMNGTERYQWFLETHEDLSDVVPQVYIANYLGLQPQSLTRIRRQLGM